MKISQKDLEAAAIKDKLINKFHTKAEKLSRDLRDNGAYEKSYATDNASMTVVKLGWFEVNTDCKYIVPLRITSMLLRESTTGRFITMTPTAASKKPVNLYEVLAALYKVLCHMKATDTFVVEAGRFTFDFTKTNLAVLTVMIAYLKQATTKNNYSWLAPLMDLKVTKEFEGTTKIKKRFKPKSADIALEPVEEEDGEEYRNFDVELPPAPLESHAQQVADAVRRARQAAFYQSVVGGNIVVDGNGLIANAKSFSKPTPKVEIRKRPGIRPITGTTPPMPPKYWRRAHPFQ